MPLGPERTLRRGELILHVDHLLLNFVLVFLVTGDEFLKFFVDVAPSACILPACIFSVARLWSLVRAASSVTKGKHFQLVRRHMLLLAGLFLA